jgi:predicted metal-dependent hydrolase
VDGAINYGDRRISYRLVENSGLTSKVRIHVHPNGVVEVETPPSTSKADITRALMKRASWISRRLDDADSVREHVLPREYVSGETHFYLGRRYQLKLIETSDRSSEVKLKGGRIEIKLPIADRVAVRRRLNAWYRLRAKDYLSKRLEEVADGIGWVDTTPPVKLVAMKKQWGSCSPSGSINLNPWLIRAPRECIDYVIVHELCHLREHNHSKRFYSLLDRHCTRWKHTKAKLDGLAELLLAD